MLGSMPWSSMSRMLKSMKMSSVSSCLCCCRSVRKAFAFLSSYSCSTRIWATPLNSCWKNSTDPAVTMSSGSAGKGSRSCSATRMRPAPRCVNISPSAPPSGLVLRLIRTHPMLGTGLASIRKPMVSPKIQRQPSRSMFPLRRTCTGKPARWS